MKKILSVACSFLFFYGCTSPVKEQKAGLAYFDLKGYFHKEAVRLQKSNPVLSKTVIVNGAAETRKLRINDWQKEFEIFTEADINRSAWSGLFKIESSQDRELYISDNKKVPVKKLLVLKKGNKPYGIQILVKNSNMLYNSADTLSYFPDSLYRVQKKQHIRLLAEKTYSITGKFK